MQKWIWIIISFLTLSWSDNFESFHYRKNEGFFWREKVTTYLEKVIRKTEDFRLFGICLMYAHILGALQQRVQAKIR